MRDATAEVLEVLIEAHRREAPTFGADIVRATKRASGTIYPILSRFDEDGLIEGRWEDPSSEECQGRPRRRYYVLTTSGQKDGGRALAEHRSRRPSPVWRLARGST